MAQGDEVDDVSEGLIDTDSDDSDYSEALDEGDISFDETDGDSSPSEGHLHVTQLHSELTNEGVNDLGYDEDEDDDDSDFEEDGFIEGSSSGGSDDESCSQESQSGSDEGSSEESVDVGTAPFTGYIFPAIHKLVAGGDLTSIASYLEEMFSVEQQGPQVWEVSDALGRNALHLAILHNRVDVLRVLLEYDCRLISGKFPSSEDEERWKFSSVRRKFDDMSVVHLALCRGPWDESTALELLNLLYAHPAIGVVSPLDYWKRTPLHTAVMTGQRRLVEFFISKHPEWISAQDSLGMLAIHYAIDMKSPILTQVLLSFLKEEILESLPEDFNLITRCVAKCSWECLAQVCGSFSGQQGFPGRALEVATELGIELGGLKDVSVNMEAAQKCVQDRARETAIVYDLDCLGHVRLPSESEDGHGRLKRIKFIVENPNRLEVLIGAYGSLKTEEFSNLRVIDSVAPCPLADVVRVHDWAYIKKVIELAESLPAGVMGKLDKGDTNVTSESWSAALKASGAVIQALDLVCSETCKNAFVAVRPPGHHVSSRGAVDPNMEDDDTGSNGFCLLNNVAVGAAYAMSVHRHVIGKVAIVDIDIHHGNGTEAIVRGLRQPKTIQLPINVTGLSGHLEMHSYHPWLDTDDANNVFFASVHRFDGKFYPQSGMSGADGHIVNAGLESFSTSRDFRSAFSHQVFPKLLDFAPDLIIISAGFDGHVRDRLASGEWDISEDDYYWVTEQLVAIANICSKGRIVSVLEGGYNTKAGWLSPLAQCVASHVRALSSSWACKWTEPPAQEDDEAASASSVVGNITDLLARADAVIAQDLDEEESSPKTKRMRSDEEAAVLFGDDDE